MQGSVHERRNAQIGMTSQAHAASLLYVHSHPTAARRAATLALRTRSARNAHLLRTEESPTPLLMSVLPDHMTTRKNVVVTIWSAEFYIIFNTSTIKVFFVLKYERCFICGYVNLFQKTLTLYFFGSIMHIDNSKEVWRK